MPEFQLDTGSVESRFWFNKRLSEFAQGYVEAMMFTDADSECSVCGPSSLDDLAAETRQRIEHDCRWFEEHAGPETLDLWGHGRAGHDFWLTRNRHGAGFWDRAMGQTDFEDQESFLVEQNRLTELAHQAGEVQPLRHDGLIYL